MRHRDTVAALLLGAWLGSPVSGQVYQLTREQSVRFDNPRIAPRLDWMVDEPLPIDKQSFRTLQSDDYDPETVFVRFLPDTPLAAREQAHVVAGARGVTWESQLVPLLYQVQVGALDVERTVNAYLDHPDTLFAEPSYRVRLDTNDPFYQDGDLWGLYGGASEDFPSTNAQWAWDEWQGSQDFIVAIIDTGVETGHPDLAANLWTNPDEIAGNRIDDDNNGYTDDVHGIYVVDDDGNVEPCGSDHGTHVAGIVGAVGNNGTGVVGVNWRCSLLAVRVSDCDGQFWNTIEALEYSVLHGASVSNHSYGSYDWSQSHQASILAAQSMGHIVVASAGNDAWDTDVDHHYPSGYDLSNVLSVAAVEEDGDIWGSPFGLNGSNYGKNTVDLGAPGDVIESTVTDSDYDDKTGTSMAAPHVTGVVALVWSKYPELNWIQVRARVLTATTPNADLDGKTVMGGVVNAHTALGIWAGPPGGSLDLGTAYNPFDYSSTASMVKAARALPGWGSLNLRAGQLPLSSWNAAKTQHGLGEKPVFLRSSGGSVRIGTP